MYKTDRHWNKYWAKRKIDWVKEYIATSNHPHRDRILQELAKIKFNTLVEVGCASGPNLLRIAQVFPHVRLGGSDVSEDALAVAKKFLPSHTVLDCAGADQLYFPDNSADVVLTDMCLIYLSTKAFRKALSEIRRVARKHVMFVEFNSDNITRRLALAAASGYHAYDYKKELGRAGFYDIQFHKLTEAEWPGGEPQKEFGYIIQASV